MLLKKKWLMVAFCQLELCMCVSAPQLTTSIYVMVYRCNTAIYLNTLPHWCLTVSIFDSDMTNHYWDFPKFLCGSITSFFSKLGVDKVAALVAAGTIHCVLAFKGKDHLLNGNRKCWCLIPDPGTIYANVHTLWLPYVHGYLHYDCHISLWICFVATVTIHCSVVDSFSTAVSVYQYTLVFLYLVGLVTKNNAWQITYYILT